MKNEILHIRLKANMQKSLTNFKTWLVLSVFVLLGAIVPQEAKANYDSRGLWYFDNTNTNWANVYLIVGRGDWTQAVKMVLQYDNIYKAESTWDNTYAFFFADSACGYSTGSGSGKDIVGSRTGNYTSNFTSKPSNNIFSPSGNGTNITGTWSTAYHLKHPWGTGNNNDWSWKVLKYNDGVYTLNALYASGKGCNYSKPNSTDEAGYVSNPTLVGSPTTGDECIFTFNPSNNAITITKVVQCNDITDVSSFSLSETTYNYNGEPKKPTVSSTLDGIGDITTKYYNSEGNEVSEPTNAGTYTVKITVSQGDTYCALTTETEVDTYTINKINQSDISIANNKTTFCGFPANDQVTLNIDGGDGDGEVVYTSEDEDIATISGNILTVKAEGTVTISAQKQAGTNHNASNTTTKSFTFYKAPNAPTVSVTNLIKCGDNTTDGVITLNNYNSNSNYTYSIVPNDEVGGNAQNGYQISIADKYTITVTRKVNETCSLSTPSATIPVVLTDNTPAATVSITGENSICNGQSSTLTCNVSTTKGNVQSYQWNLNDTPIQGATESTYNASETGNYTVVVTVNNNGCTDEFTNSTPFSLTVNPLPAAPSLISPAPVCEGTTVNLPTGYNWYNAETGGTEVQNTAISVTGTYWAAAVQNGCESARTRYDVTVNPKPSIGSIAQSVQSPVPFEDVVLTATGVTQGAEVKWYLGDDVTPVATGTTYIVTSETAGDVIVKAKAFLNDCESNFKVYTVTFSEEEDCESTITTHTTKTKILFTKPSTWDKIYIYSWDITDPNSNGWPGYEITGEEYYVFENVTKDFNIVLNNGSGNGTNQTVNGEGLKAGKVYSLTIGGTSSTCTDGKRCLDLGDPTDFTTTSDPELSAPAVKTVSVNSEQGSGVVNFVGKVIKTGCAAGTDIWVGYQYKKKDDVWPTTGVTAGTGEKELIPIGNNLVDFSKNIEGLADDDYHFRAYVINGYGRSADPNDYDQGVYYGIDILVKVSSIKEAVKDPVLQWIDGEGNPYADGAYCPDATAYVKLTYGGSKPETVVWSNSISDSNPVLVKESLGENWYKLTVEKSGDLSVSLANEYNTTGAVQADAISLTMTSRISFPTTEVIDGKTTICSNDANGTKLRVTNAVVDYQYALYKVTDEAAGTSTKVEGPIPATNENKDNLTFTIQGSEAAGKYFVQVEETDCDQTAVSQGYTTIEVINAGAITLTLEPNEVTVNPWLPAVLTVSITEGYDYTIDIPAPLVYTANGNVYTIKAPEPAGAEYPQQNQKQYGKITFDDEEYTVTADLKTDTGSSCITPQTSTIILTPYVEDCVIDHENQ